MKKVPVDVPKLEMLYRLYEQEMYRVCVAVLGDSFSAEDAVSESFLKLIRIRDSIKKPDSAETRHLCIKTARNTAINMYRKRSRERKYYEGLPDTEMRETSVLLKSLRADFVTWAETCFQVLPINTDFRQSWYTLRD